MGQYARRRVYISLRLQLKGLVVMLFTTALKNSSESAGDIMQITCFSLLNRRMIVRSVGLPSQIEGLSSLLVDVPDAYSVETDSTFPAEGTKRPCISYHRVASRLP